MSLAALALRIATVQALKGRTWVGDNVRDSEIGAIDDNAADAPQPFLVVYTDDGTFLPRGESRELLSGGTVGLAIELALTQRMLVEVRAPSDDNPSGEYTVDWRMPPTDAGLEITLNALGWQIRSTLASAEGEWPELWRSLALATANGQFLRGANAAEGMRFAGTSMKMLVEVPREPVPGRPLTPLWVSFFDLCAKTPELIKTGAMLRAMIETPAEPPEWLAIKQGWGLTLAEARALGLLPPPPSQSLSVGTGDVVAP